MLKCKELMNLQKETKIFEIYQKVFHNLNLKMNKVTSFTECHWMPTLVFNEKCEISKEMLQEALLNKNIDAEFSFGHYPCYQCFRIKLKIRILSLSIKEQ